MIDAVYAHDLCDVEDIDDPGSRGFDVTQDDGASRRLFVVRKNDRYSAYLNQCPHTGAPLEWVPDQFLDIDSDFIQCSIHGALFRPEDGYCVRGPCVGRSLRPLELNVTNGRIRVLLPEAVT